MVDETELNALAPDRVFDGGDLDCGSGLVLLLRENMLAVPEGGVLEMRSVEPSVGSDLPPWCRMVGHEFLGSIAGEKAGLTRYFVRRGSGAASVKEREALETDKARAREYEWRVRVRASGHLESTVYCRNFSWKVGQPASFEEKDAHPAAVEYLLGALCADLGTAFRTECSRRGLAVDDIEISARGRLHNIMAHLGVEDGDPSFAAIALKCFASSFEDEGGLRETWDAVVARSPLAQTLAKAAQLELKLAIV